MKEGGKDEGRTWHELHLARAAPGTSCTWHELLG
jgi:hypothetical protein